RWCRRQAVDQALGRGRDAQSPRREINRPGRPTVKERGQAADLARELEIAAARARVQVEPDRRRRPVRAGGEPLGLPLRGRAPPPRRPPTALRPPLPPPPPVPAGLAPPSSQLPRPSWSVSSSTSTSAIASRSTTISPCNSGRSATLTSARPTCAISGREPQGA